MKKYSLAPALLVTTLALAACSDDDNDNDAVPPAEPPAGMVPGENEPGTGMDPDPGAGEEAMTPVSVDGLVVLDSAGNVSEAIGVVQAAIAG